MKTFYISILVICSMLASFAADSNAPREFVNLYKKWDSALCAADLAALDQIYASEVKLTSTEGVDTKESWLKMVKSGEYKCSNPVTSELDVKTYGDFAVCTGIWKASEIFKGEKSEDPMRFTDIWMKRDGRWQVIASHVSLVKPAAK